MDPIKEAFQKAKEDIDSLRKEIEFLKINLRETREKMIEICEIIQKIDEKTPKNTPKQHFDTSTYNLQKLTPSTHPSILQQTPEALKTQNIAISTGNQGVPTDRQQTDNRQTTDTKTPFLPEKQENSIDNAAEMLDSLDNVKKEIRLKFKRLTDKEVLVFSTLYQLEGEKAIIDYKTVADRLDLSESSIRDYVGRLIKKGIPVEKHKINNKQIHLKISKNLRKIASLPTILQLRDL
jgi:hypothetical protein